jgi:hypothetical protein
MQLTTQVAGGEFVLWSRRKQGERLVQEERGKLLVTRSGIGAKS